MRVIGFSFRGRLIPTWIFIAGLTALNRAAERVPLVAILNPNSGPGAGRNSDYVNAIQALRVSGGRVIGYVSSAYTTRAAEEVRGDIDRYYSFYEIDGIFIDEMTNDSNAEHVAY